MGLAGLWQRCNRIKTFQQMALGNLDFVRKKKNFGYYISHTPHYENKFQGLHIKYRTIKLIGKKKTKGQDEHQQQKPQSRHESVLYLRI